MRRFFVKPEAIAGQTAILGSNEAEHIRRVLKLKNGAPIILFDGTGTEFTGVIDQISHSQVHISILKRYTNRNEPPIQLAVGQALLKEKKMDRLVRSLTEIGVTSWYPFTSERSIPKISPQKWSRRHERLQKITQEALKQCKRGIPPHIGPLLTFDEALTYGKAYDVRLIFWENASAPVLPPQNNGNKINSLCILMGPEGGFSNHEIDAAKACGYHPVRLGPRVLRADTAPVVACAILQFLFGDLGEKIS